MPLLDRCYFNATTSGTADFAIGTAITGALVPATAGGINGAMYPYIAQSTDQTQWEIGLATYVATASYSFSNDNDINDTNIASNGTAFVDSNLAAPTGPQAGDLIVLYLGFVTRSVNGANYATTAPSIPGFTNTGGLFTSGSSNPILYGRLYYKISTGTEPANYTITTTDLIPNGTSNFIAYRATVGLWRPSGGIATFDKVTGYNDTGSAITQHIPALSGLNGSGEMIISYIDGQGGAAQGAALTIGSPYGVRYNASNPPFLWGFDTVAFGSVGTSVSQVNDTSGNTFSGLLNITGAFYVAAQQTLQRTIVLNSSNSGAKVNFSSPPQIAISPTAGLDFNNATPVTKTANYTVDSGTTPDTDIICNGAGSITLTLPSAPAWPGRKLTVRTIAAQTVVSASSNVIPSAGGAAGTAILAGTAGKWAALQSDGTNWQIQMSN